MRTKRWIFAWAWTIGATLLTACGPRPAPAPPPGPPLATLAFSIADCTTGRALEGVSIRLHTGEQQVTNQDGYAKWDGLLRGPRHVWLERTEHAPKEFDVPVDRAENPESSCLVSLKPKPPPGPVHPNPIVGRLRLSGRMLAQVPTNHAPQLDLTPACYSDDNGCFNPVGAHAGDLFWLFTTDRPRALAEMDKAVAKRYQLIRSWMQLGCGIDGRCDPNYRDSQGRPHFWVGREVGPWQAPYWADVKAFLEALHARGLKLVWSQGDIAQTGHTMAARRAYAAHAARVAAEVHNGFVVAFWDAGNEVWQPGNDADRLHNGADGPANMASFVKAYQDAGGTAILSLTDAPGETCHGATESFEAYTRPPAMVFDAHTWRDGEWWDKARHPWTISYECKPKLRIGINSEPPGSGRLVSAIANIEDLDHEAVGNIAVLSAIGRQAFVWFSGEGVKLDRGLDTEQGFANVPAAIELLPKDVMRWTQLHHSGDNWRSIRVFELTPNPDVRVDGVINADGRFVYLAHGPSGHHSFRVARSFTGQVCNLGTVECHPIARKAGETLELDWVRGRLLLGAVQ